MQFTQIKETCLYVKNLDETKKFYHEKLGLEVIDFVKDRHVFFRVGTSVLLCFIPESTQNEKLLPTHYAKGQIHLAFEVPKKNYESMKSKILSLNIAIEHEQRWQSHYRSFYFRDPDNHLLEIVQEGMWNN